MGDPFQTLGLPRTFDLSAAEIRRAWLSRAAEAHPDRAGDREIGGDPEAQRRAAALNSARRTLEDAETRADALLVLLGGPDRAQEKGLSPTFLMEIMEVRQELEAALGSRDEAELARLRRWADEQRAAYTARVGELFAALPSAADAESLRAIRLALNEWRYIERMIEQSADE